MGRNPPITLYVSGGSLVKVVTDGDEAGALERDGADEAGALERDGADEAGALERDGMYIIRTFYSQELLNCLPDICNNFFNVTVGVDDRFVCVVLCREPFVVRIGDFFEVRLGGAFLCGAFAFRHSSKGLLRGQLQVDVVFAIVDG